MKHLKKLLAALLVVAMVIAMVPAVFAAGSGDAAGTAMDSIWDDINAMYAATATKDGKAADPVATAQKAAAIVERADAYVDGSLTWNGNGAFTWKTEDGITGLYNAQLMADRAGKSARQSKLALEDIVNQYNTIYESTITGTYGLQKVGTYTYTRSYGDSADTIVLFGPYYGGLDESFTDAYLSNAVKMAKAAKCKLVVYARDAANVANLGKAMASAKLVLFDSHGTTDYYEQTYYTTYPDYYYNIDDCTSEANVSYLCLTTGNSITSADCASAYGPYASYDHAVSIGDGQWAVDGTVIANHMSGNANGNFVWIGSCLGMATNTIQEPLRNKGVSAVYGYSQSVTFYGDMAYLYTAAEYLSAGHSFARGIQAAKQTWGSWDPINRYYYTFWEADRYGNNHYWYDYYYEPTLNGQACGTPTLAMLQRDKIAFPITVSDKDRYPGQHKVDNIQQVYCDWYLTSPASVHDRFVDVPDGVWYISAVDYVLIHNIMSGNTNGTFAPEKALTRAELVTLLWSKEGKPEAASAVSFNDVADSDWFAAKVKWAAAAGIVSGYTDGSFQPNKQVSRQELAQMIFAYAKYKNVDVSASGSLAGFSDSNTAGNWARPALQWAVGAGILSGSNGRLMPTSSAKRCEVASMFMRFVENFKLG